MDLWEHFYWEWIKISLIVAGCSLGVIILCCCCWCGCSKGLCDCECVLRCLCCCWCCKLCENISSSECCCSCCRNGSWKCAPLLKCLCCCWCCELCEKKSSSQSCRYQDVESQRYTYQDRYSPEQPRSILKNTHTYPDRYPRGQSTSVLRVPLTATSSQDPCILTVRDEEENFRSQRHSGSLSKISTDADLFRKQQQQRQHHQQQQQQQQRIPSAIYYAPLKQQEESEIRRDEENEKKLLKAKLMQKLRMHGEEQQQKRNLQNLFIELDLHNFSLNAAMDTFKLFLAVAKHEYNDSNYSRSKRFVLVITGWGKHSENGPVIKPAVEGYLLKHDYTFNWTNQGSVRIDLISKRGQ